MNSDSESDSDGESSSDEKDQETLLLDQQVASAIQLQNAMASFISQ
jgi:hypothetical protein